MEVDSKLGMSLDDLIKKQRVEVKAKTPKPKAKKTPIKAKASTPAKSGKVGARQGNTVLVSRAQLKTGRGGATASGVAKRSGGAAASRPAPAGNRGPTAPMVVRGSRPGGRPGAPASAGGRPVDVGSARRVVVSLDNSRARGGGRPASNSAPHYGAVDLHVSAPPPPPAVRYTSQPPAVGVPASHRNDGPVAARRNAHGILIPA